MSDFRKYLNKQLDNKEFKKNGITLRMNMI